MSKFATTFILDVGNSMQREDSMDKTTYLEKATTVLKSILDSKIIQGRKTDVVELIFAGTDETDNPLAEDGQYENLNLKFSFTQANIKMIKYLDSLKKKPNNGNVDIMDALILALFSMNNFCKKLKYEKRIYILTDCQNDMLLDDFTTVKDQILSMNVSIDRKNEEILKEITEFSNGLIFLDREAISALSQLRTKSVKPTTLLRAPLTFGDPESHPEETLSISVYTYLKTSELSAKSAKKWSSIAENTEPESRTCKVDTVRTLKVTKTNEDGMDEDITVEKEDLIKAYRFGKTLVRYTADDEEAMKFRCSKGLSILGFVKKQKIKRWWLISNTISVIPEPGNSYAHVQFASLYKALFETEYCAMVRFCAREDSALKIGCLVPHEGKPYLLFCQLPYAEDLRPYEFTNLKSLLDPENIKVEDPNSSSSLKPKRNKLEARTVKASEAIQRMENFILSMDLMHAIKNPKGETKEAYKTKDIFNPYIQRVNQCISHRATNQIDSFHPTPLPLCDPKFLASITPIPSLIESSRSCATALKEAFTLLKQETTKKTGKRQWQSNKDILPGENVDAIAADRILQNMGNEDGPDAKRRKGVDGLLEINSLFE
ncbi:X-ray repair cross-complementing protein 5, partial [Clydaea vesicula]